MVRGSRGRHNYIDGQLQKRSRYYIFRDWANTPDAVLAEAGPRRKVVATAPGQCLDAWQWRHPRESRTVFKQHADNVFSGHTWLDVLSQMPNGRLPLRVRGLLEPDHQPAAAGRNIT